jgi:hypothetical protein
MKISWRWMGALAVAAASQACVVASPDEGSESEDATEKVAKIALTRTWLLVGDGLTTGDAQVKASFTLPKSYKNAAVAIDTPAGAKPVTRGADGKFAAALPLGKLTTGDHKLLVVSSDGKRTLGSATFHLSAPLYIVVSTDWDDTRMDDSYLARMEGVRQHHPELKVTQFFAPYHYTDPKLTPGRKQQIDAWIKEQRDQYGDELGVHIHGWCHFVTTTGVPCRTKESFYYDDGSGYTTILAAYSEAEMTTILQKSRETFAAHGLGAPTSFRAGGWTADVKVLRALAKTGFMVDTSAVPASHLSSWKGYGLYTWTTSHWQGITETSQPYFPLASNPAAADPAKALPVLEVPDNGVLVDYVTADEMTAIYRMNHPGGGTLANPTVYQIGWHPPNFSNEFMNRIDTALAEVDKHLYSKDAGPARYVNISELTKVWKR